MSYVTRSLIMMGTIAGATLVGWLVRRQGWSGDRLPRVLMTIVAIAGYPIIGMLAIWQMDIVPADAWLPVLMAVHMAAMTLIGLAIGGVFAPSRADRGLFSLSCGISNMGPTMGGFVVYLLYGEDGLGVVSVLTLCFLPVVVLLAYPIARHYSPVGERIPLRQMELRSLLDWRMLPLLPVTAGILLSVSGIPRPAFFTESHLITVALYLLLVLAYLSIGLRLHAGDFAKLKGMIAGMAGVRFLLAPLIALGMLAVVEQTPLGDGWGLLNRRVFLIESFVPTAVSVVAVANMFYLHPRHASALFVANTVMYVVLVLPWVGTLLGPD